MKIKKTLSIRAMRADNQIRKVQEFDSSIEWHEEMLKACEKALLEGKATFISFDQVKERLRNQINSRLTTGL